MQMVFAIGNLPLWYSTQFTNKIPVVIRGGAIVGFKAAFLANVNNARALFFVQFNANRLHKPFAFGKPIARSIKVDMQRPQAMRTVVSAAATLVRFCNFVAFFTLETLIYFNWIPAFMHIILS